MKLHAQLADIGNYTTPHVNGMVAALTRMRGATLHASRGRLDIVRASYQPGGEPVLMFRAERQEDGSWVVTTIPGLLSPVEGGGK